jgi:hypothetical protein
MPDAEAVRVVQEVINPPGLPRQVLERKPARLLPDDAGS